MQEISDPALARGVLTDPAFRVPPVPPGSSGLAWLRATVSRFADGPAHTRRRALVEELLAAVDPASLAAAPPAHPVATLAAALGLPSAPTLVEDVRLVAASYQPPSPEQTSVDLPSVGGPGARVDRPTSKPEQTSVGGPGAMADRPTSEPAADAAVERLVAMLGGTRDERTAAHLCLLVQACAATETLIDRARTSGVDEVLRDDPPVPATRRQATADTTVGGMAIAAGEVVRVSLAADPFGAGPRVCPGRAHALALAEGAAR
ncbi:cytochrome P450 [Dactylosporangium sp. AC04546]|uniref:cytochrome P450 n=1 Tax=Dactylosporangium sp. AC04546 TaxID=2862460 RepID=UPI001EDF3DFC|nr:cytochrome P450 [Dactylosporangium sp. AC04546]WVK85796.1 cytochrome P450 [Dactylosporangium sp. AC04546]